MMHGQLSVDIPVVANDVEMADRESIRNTVLPGAGPRWQSNEVLRKSFGLVEGWLVDEIHGMLNGHHDVVMHGP